MSAVRSDRTVNVFFKFRYAIAKTRHNRFPTYPERVAFLIATTLSLLCLVSDGVLFRPPDLSQSRHVYDSVSMAVVPVGIALLYFFNIRVVYRFFRWSGRNEARIKPWIKALRLALAGLPVVGLWVVVVWQYLEPKGLLQQLFLAHDVVQSAGVRKLLLKKRLSVISSSPKSSWFMISILVSAYQMFNTFCFGFFVMYAAVLRPSAPWVIVLAIMVRLFGFGFLLYSLHTWARRALISLPATYLLCSITLIWLVPLPIVATATGLLVALVGVFYSPLLHGEHTLIHRTYEARRELGRVPFGLMVEDTTRDYLWSIGAWRRVIHAGWLQGFERPRQLTSVKKKLQVIYRVRSFVLPIDVAAFTIAVLLLARKAPALALVMETLLATVITCAVSLVVSSYLGVFLARLFHIGLEQSGQRILLRALRHLGRTQLALIIGALLGEAIFRGDIVGTGNVLTGIAGLAGLSMVMIRASELLAPLGDESEEDYRWAMVMLLSSIGLLVLGSLITTYEPHMHAKWQLLTYSVLCLPVLGCLYGGFRLGWFLQPYRLRQILAHQLPGTHRLVLLCALLSLMLPMGGLLIPVLVALRSRYWSDASPIIATDRDA